MPFPYKRVLVIGATSGIGEALASKLVNEGSKVIVVGRRNEKLEQFVQKHGKDKASAASFDITDLDKIPNFAADLTKSFEDIDCVFINSGIQRKVDFSKPDEVDLSAIQTEFTTNYLSYIALAKAFLPFFQSKKTESALIFTSSVLALVPMTRCPNYCASKAALHQLLLCMRQQLKSSSPQVKIVELYPPAVQTELHDQKHQPDIKDGRSIGMPLDEFTEKAYAGLAAGKEQVPVGIGADAFEKFETSRQEMYSKWA